MQLTVTDAAGLLDVPQSTVYRWINEDNLPAKEVNGQYHFSPADLLEWASAHGVAVRADRLDPNAESRGPQQESAASALEAGGIFYDLPGADKATVLASVVNKLPAGEAANRALLLELFLAREAAGSTAVGDGIAIPHPRHPVVLPVRRPLLSICFLSRPIDFGPKVPENVDTLLVLICPTIQSHLRMLARVACLLKDETMRTLIKRRATAAELLEAARRVERSLAAANAEVDSDSH